MTTTVKNAPPLRRPARVAAAIDHRRAVAILVGAVAMIFVGASTAVSARLQHAPLATVQALRYAIACLLLVAAARVRGPLPPRPRGREWAWLVGVALTGMVAFNVALVRGAAHAEPAVFGVAVACVPLTLALGGPLLHRRRPRGVVAAAAALVTGGAALVTGLGRSDGLGLAWAALVLGCELGFTTLAVPVLGRLGPWGVSIHTTWLAAVMFGALALIGDGPGAVGRLDEVELAALAYLAVGMTALAFVLWYTAVRRLGAGVAGLLTGVAPASAAAAGPVLDGPAPLPLVWVGVAVVAAGLVVGLRPAGSAGSDVEAK